MERHFTLTDIEFEKQFQSCSLDPAIFTNEAHLRLAWIHITNYGAGIAVDNIRCQLQNFVDSLGAKNKYNETVTMAAVKAVYHFMLKSKTDNFRDFITENLRLKNSFKELMSFHYQTDIFKSPTAKEKYLMPELLPFD